ncbi:hypothetical protein FKP32DRAFT_1592121, partial [Trametes sanguinea]
MDDDEERKPVYSGSASSVAGWPGSASASSSGFGAMSSASGPGLLPSASPTPYYSPTMSVGSSSYASLPPYSSPTAQGPSSGATLGLGTPLTLGPALGVGLGPGMGLRSERGGRDRLPDFLTSRGRGAYGEESGNGAG